MTALGITTLQLQIADFKFSNTFIICDRLWNYYLSSMYRRNSQLSYGRDQEKNCYIQKEGRKEDSLPASETVNRRQMLLL